MALSKEKEYKYLKPLKVLPSLPEKAMSLSEGKKAAIEFVNSKLQFAEVNVEGYSSVGVLARNLGRILHGAKGLDPDRKIEVRSDPIKAKVYLIRKS